VGPSHKATLEFNPAEQLLSIAHLCYGSRGAVHLVQAFQLIGSGIDEWDDPKGRLVEVLLKQFLGERAGEKRSSWSMAAKQTPLFTFIDDVAVRGAHAHRHPGCISPKGKSLKTSDNHKIVIPSAISGGEMLEIACLRQ